MDSVEAEGTSIDEAIASALRMLGTTRDRVEVDILSDAARGFFGFGARKARVRATRRAPLGSQEPAPPDRGGTIRPAATTVDTARRERGASPRDAGTTMQPSAVREAGRGLRAAAAAHPRREAPAAADDAGPIAPAVVRPNRPQAAAAVDPEAVERVATLLREVIQHLGVTADVTVKRTDDDQFVIDLSGDASGVLIGRRGQMLDALEYLMNRVLTRDGSEGTRIILDVENYRARRREALESMARRSAEQAKKKGMSVTLSPMNPRDRRIVHMFLQSDPSLVTKSAGVGYLRKLVITPAAGERRRRNSSTGNLP